MAVPFSCKCEKKDKKNWVIVCLFHNHSYFEAGPRGTKHNSDYSTVRCTQCGAHGRTKAQYVMGLDYDKDSICNQREGKV